MKSNRKKLTKWLSAALLLPLFPSIGTVGISAETRTNAAAVDLTAIMEPRVYDAGTLTLPYRLYVPADYTPEERYPVILFLHGAGEVGADNAAQLKNAIGQMFADPHSPVYRCIVVAPQCPAGSKWVQVSDWTQTQYSTEEVPESAPLRAVVGLLEQLKTDYSVDADRVYATGLSMGGYGTWDLLVRHTELFAAGIPVCGGADWRKAERLKNVPVYTFHGLKDPVVPPQGTERMVQAIREAGGTRVTYVTYPEGDHAIWEMAFGTEGLYDWLLAQRRSDRLPDGEETTAIETTPVTEPVTEAEPDVVTDPVTEASSEVVTDPVTEATAEVATELETEREDAPAEQTHNERLWRGLAVAAGIAAVVTVATLVVKGCRRGKRGV